MSELGVLGVHRLREIEELKVSRCECEERSRRRHRQSGGIFLAQVLAVGLWSCGYSPQFEHTMCAVGDGPACPAGYVCDLSAGPPGYCAPRPDASSSGLPDAT
ncbi:MAG TPA: hypothetical protein VIU64_13830, partial [Polyangia bacterium]